MPKRSSIVNAVFLWYALAACFFLSAAPSCLAEEGPYGARLDKGLSNTDPYAYLLIGKAAEDKAKAREYLLQARKYAPDLPAVYFALARESFSLTAGGIFKSIDFVREGISAHGRNFWWRYHALGILLLGLLLSGTLALLITIAMRLSAQYRLLSHDVREHRNRLLMFICLPILALFGFFALAAGLLMIIGLYFPKKDKLLVYAVLLLLALSQPLALDVKQYLSAPAPELKATVAVNESRDNQYALSILGNKGDFASSFSYALALKREGRYQEAVNLYSKLFGGSADPLVYINLGNTFYGLGDLEAAKESYLKAVKSKPLPAAYYNLSQVHRQLFDFPKGDEYFLESAKLDSEAVSRFAAVSGTNPNRFVIDETLSIPQIRNFLLTRTDETIFPYILGALLIIAFYVLNGQMTVKAHLCKRCGAISCPKCSRTLALSGMCPQCYTFLIKVGELDAKERIARLLAMQQSQARRRSLIRVLSSAIPGTGHIYAGSALAGFLMLWLFLFSVTVAVLCRLSLVGIAPFTQSWMMPVALVLAGLAYATSIFTMKKGLSKGWV